MKSPKTLVLVLILVTGAIAGYSLWSGSSAAGPILTDTLGASADPEATPANATASSIATPDTELASTERPARREVTGGEATARVRIRGRLVLADGSPATAAFVEFVARVRSGPPMIDLELFSGTRNEPAERVASDDEGRFELMIGAGERGSLRMSADSGFLFDVDQKKHVSIPGYRSDRDLGELALRLAASLAGSVRDRDGKPIAEAKISLAVDQSLPFIMPRERTRTDPDGRFAICGLDAATVHLRVSAPGFVPATRKITLAVGNHLTNLDFEMTQGGNIVGIVVDDLGAPVVAAKVAPSRKRNLGGSFSFDQMARDEAATTDRDGRFALRGLDGETASFEVTAEGYDRHTRTNVPVGSNNLVVTLTRHASISGVLVDAGGHPIADSQVRVERVDRERPHGVSVEYARSAFEYARRAGRSTVKTAADGSFTVEDVAAGHWTVVCRGKNHLEARSVPVELRAGQAAEGVRIVAEAGASLDVLVVDAEGTPVAGAEVGVHEHTAAESNEWRRTRQLAVDAAAPMLHSVLHGGSSLGKGVTDETGHALIQGLPVRAVDVTATHDDFVASAPKTTTLVTNETASARLMLAPGGFLDVLVVGAAGEPIAEAGFRVEGPLDDADAKSHEVAKTDGEGAARVGPLRPGRYSIALQLPARPMHFGGSVLVLGQPAATIDETRVEARVSASDSTPIRLVQPILTTVTGVVTDASGPVANARVRLRNGDAKNQQRGGSPSDQTDAEGRYRMSSVPAGDWTIEFGRRNAAVMCREPLPIPAGTRSLERDLELRGGSVRLRVLDHEGEPVERARVTIARAGESKPGSTDRYMLHMLDATEGGSVMFAGGQTEQRTDEDGIAVLDDVPAGDYVLTIRHQRYLDGRVENIVSQLGKLTDAGDVQIERSSTVIGEIQGLVGSGRSAHVEITSLERENETRTVTARDGKFRITKLRAGRYNLRARERSATPQIWGPAREIEVEAGKPARATLALQ